MTVYKGEAGRLKTLVATALNGGPIPSARRGTASGCHPNFSLHKRFFMRVLRWFYGDWGSHTLSTKVIDIAAACLMGFALFIILLNIFY